MRGLGTLLNLVAVAAGGLGGAVAGDRIPDAMRRTIMQGLGLTVVAVAIGGFGPLYGADKGLERFIIMIVAVISGGLIGEALALESRLESAGGRLRRRLGVAEGAAGEPGAHARFVDGFVIASTLFCVGPLSLLGSVQDGLGRGIRLLAIKSALDGFASVGIASVYGIGVLGSLITIALYQGAVTAAAALIEPILTGEALAELSAVGSLLVLGIGLRLLEVVEIRVVNLLPSLVIGPLLAGALERLA